MSKPINVYYFTNILNITVVSAIIFFAFVTYTDIPDKIVILDYFPEWFKFKKQGQQMTHLNKTILFWFLLPFCCFVGNAFYFLMARFMPTVNPKNIRIEGTMSRKGRLDFEKLPADKKLIVMNLAFRVTAPITLVMNLILLYYMVTFYIQVATEYYVPFKLYTFITLFVILVVLFVRMDFIIKRLAKRLIAE